MKANSKILQLQIRVSRAEKTAIMRYAKNAGVGLSQWVLNKVFPPQQEVFQEFLSQLKNSPAPKSLLAQIHDLFKKVTPDEFESMVAQPPKVVLSSYLANYITAMIEYTAVQKGKKAPSWTQQIPPLDQPVFGSDLKNLTLYLLTHSPPPFRRRNIFIDATVGQRI